ncbi:MAG: DUF748 domain-containing protein [Oceanococcus sp.]
MNTSVKTTTSVVAIGVIFAVVVAVFIIGQLNRLIKSGVEETGPKVTGTPVSLQSAKVSIFSGSGALNALQIKNPVGFSSANAFDLQEISIALDIKSISNDVVVIRELKIDGAKLVTELTAIGQSNLKTILDHAKQMAGQSSSEPQSDDSAAAPKFIIQSFSFTNAQLQALAPSFDVDETLVLPDIYLSDVGAKSNGATAVELAELLLQPIINTATREARSEFIAGKASQLKQKLSDKLQDLFD